MSGKPKEGGNLARQRRQTAADTTEAARAILQSETAARDKKTARLRALRLAQEASNQAEIAAKGPAAKSTKKGQAAKEPAAKPAKGKAKKAPAK